MLCATFMTATDSSQASAETKAWSRGVSATDDRHGRFPREDLPRTAINGPPIRLGATRCLSHVFVMDGPSIAELVLVDDVAINIAPAPGDEVGIVQSTVCRWRGASANRKSMDLRRWRR